MSAFPNEFFGPPGEELNTYTLPAGQGVRQTRYQLGTLMKMRDGRWFRFCGNDATLEVAGDLYQMPAPVTNHVSLDVAAAAAADATTVSVTLGATAVTADQYKDGYIVFEDSAGTGFGYLYAIGEHGAVSSSGTFAVPLRPPYKLKVAVTTSTQATLVAPPWDDVIIHPSPPTEPVVGVAVAAVAANQYGWYQVKGICAWLEQGTTVAGDAVIASESADGAVAPSTATTASFVGECVRAVGDGKIGVGWANVVGST